MKLKHISQILIFEGYLYFQKKKKNAFVVLKIKRQNKKNLKSMLLSLLVILWMQVLFVVHSLLTIKRHQY